MTEEFETWLTAYDQVYAALPTRADTPCPECGEPALHLVFTGEPTTRRAYAQLWCDRCVRGIHLSQTIAPPNAPMNDYRVPREEHTHQTPDFTLIQP